MSWEILLNIFQPEVLLFTALGTLIGVVMGAIPGLNSGIGIAILLPFTYRMEPATALLFLGGLYMGSGYGGSVSGILINVPGTVEASCTALEGYPMSVKGKGRQALNYALISSSFGGLVGVLAMIFLTPLLASFAVKFGPMEMFLVSLCGLVIVGSLTGNNIYSGVFAAAFGMFMSMIGIDDITGIPRFTFGLKPLIGGIQLIPVVIGIFALAEMIKQALDLRNNEGTATAIHIDNSHIWPIFKDIFSKNGWLLLKSSVIGILIGIIPGTGGAISSFIAYGEAKRTSRQSAMFGNGNPEGIIGPESANNSAVGGALVPMLSLGIPGSSTTAIMFGALLIHGLIPGPNLFIENARIGFTFSYGMLLTVVFMFLVGVFGVKIWTRVLKIKLQYLIPIVIASSLIGAYSVRNSTDDVLIAVVFGVVGLLFSKIQIPTAPIVLGLILGPLVERNLTRTLTIIEAKKVSFFSYLVDSPLSLVIVGLTLLMIITTLRVQKKQKLAAAKEHIDLDE
jgi:putative tricarboxylic transport membrane protein